MYSIRKGVTFESLPAELKESFELLGFKKGDNISEMFQNFLDEKDISLDEYIFQFHFLEIKGQLLKEFKMKKSPKSASRNINIEKIENTLSIFKLTSCKKEYKEIPMELQENTFRSGEYGRYAI